MAGGGTLGFIFYFFYFHFRISRDWRRQPNQFASCTPQAQFDMEGQIQISSSVLRTLKNTAQDRPYASVSQCHMQLEVPLNLKALGEGLVESAV